MTDPRFPADPHDEAPDAPDAPDARLREALVGGAVAEEARALAEVAGDLDALAAAAPEGLRPDVRAAALAAWEAQAAVGAPAEAAASPRLRALPPTGRPARVAVAAGPHWLRWAALLVVGLGLTLFATLAAPEDATAGLRVATLLRLDQVGGRQETILGREVPWGEHLEAAAHEVIGLRLGDGSAVVLSDGGRLRVDRGEDGGPVLRAQGGTVQVAVASGGVVRLQVVRCRLHVAQGRAWVRAADGRFALGPGGRGRLVLPDGNTDVLVGPGAWTCDGSGRFVPVDEALEPADFRLPAGLRANHVGRAPGRAVAARQWRVVDGRGRRRGTSLVPGPTGLRIAWRPSPDVRRAHTLRLRIEGGEGLVVRLGDGEPVPVARATDLALPSDWYLRAVADGGELVLALQWARPGGEGARFLGATFLSDDDTNAATDPSPRRE